MTPEARSVLSEGALASLGPAARRAHDFVDFVDQVELDPLADAVETPSEPLFGELSFVPSAIDLDAVAFASVNLRGFRGARDGDALDLRGPGRCHGSSIANDSPVCNPPNKNDEKVSGGGRGATILGLKNLRGWTPSGEPYL